MVVEPTDDVLVLAREIGHLAGPRYQTVHFVQPAGHDAVLGMLVLGREQLLEALGAEDECFEALEADGVFAGARVWPQVTGELEGPLPGVQEVRVVHERIGGRGGEPFGKPDVVAQLSPTELNPEGGSRCYEILECTEVLFGVALDGVGARRELFLWCLDVHVQESPERAVSFFPGLVVTELGKVGVESRVPLPHLHSHDTTVGHTSVTQFTQSPFLFIALLVVVDCR